MPSEIAQLWIDALKSAVTHPNDPIKCPECQEGVLIIDDTPYGEGRFERWMICDKCGCHNEALMSSDSK